MNNKRMRIIVGLLTACLVALLSANAQGDKTKVKGLITARTGDTIILKTTDGGSITVTLDDDTKVQQPKGLGVRKKQMSAAALIPGLKVSVDGTSQDATQVLAKSITFDKDDLQTAEMIQAGLNPTEQKVAANQQNIAENKQNIEANKQATAANQQSIAANKASIDANAAEASKRFSELSEYDTKDQLNVRFASGRATISPADQEALKKLAHNAVNLTGYIIQVKGFADSSGNAAMNQKLSMERAQNVIAFLLQNCNGRSSRLRVGGHALDLQANQEKMYDALTVNEWLKAEAHRETAIADPFERRFLPEFRPAFEAWKQTDPVHNPKAPAGPMAMPEFRNTKTDEATAKRSYGISNLT